GRSREDLALAGGDRRVAGDKLGHHSAGRLDTQSQRAHVHEHNISRTLLTGKDTCLDGGAEGDGLVGVDALGSLLATEELLDEALDDGDTGGATDEDDVVNLGLLGVGVL